MERALAAYWNGNLVDMLNLGTVQYCFVLRSNLGMTILKIDG
jgi:hypothetical protein